MTAYIIRSEEFFNLVCDAIDELQRTDRRVDYESLAQFTGIAESVLRRCVNLTPQTVTYDQEVLPT